MKLKCKAKTSFVSFNGVKYPIVDYIAEVPEEVGTKLISQCGERFEIFQEPEVEVEEEQPFYEEVD